MAFARTSVSFAAKCNVQLDRIRFLLTSSPVNLTQDARSRSSLSVNQMKVCTYPGVPYVNGAKNKNDATRAAKKIKTTTRALAPKSVYILGRRCVTPLRATEIGYSIDSVSTKLRTDPATRVDARWAGR